ncbi:PilW family protein [Variovorax soli]|uniref:PilW family protein n=1 Tax=Variovorax soli TaxID=376815 RepID=UPI00137B1923|nr:PilW family protein [Variovorax soli]
MYTPERMASNPSAAHNRQRAAGTMLVELMVALALASIAIAAAIAALMVARDAAAAIHEMTLLQQQASYALRSMGRQIRSAGSLELQAIADGPSAVRFALPTVSGTSRVHGTDGGPGASDSLTLAHVAPPLLPGLQRDCLGQTAAPGTRTLATFQVDANGNLICRSSSGRSQPLIAGVAAFKLRFRVDKGAQLQSMSASEVEAAQQWPAVRAVEVCLELRGEQRVTASEHEYIGCFKRSARSAGRMTLVTRRLFLLNALLED